MVDRYTAPPLELPRTDDPFVRADLIFYDLDHSSSSFEARLFVNAPRADHTTGRDDAACIGSFFIFGHGGCFGDTGHCELPVRADPFDLRPPHALQPAIRIVTVTETIQRLVADRQPTATITVVAHAAADKPNDVLSFETVRLATYA
jgi:hypothetical protein